MNSVPIELNIEAIDGALFVQGPGGSSGTLDGSDEAWRLVATMCEWIEHTPPQPPGPRGVRVSVRVTGRARVVVQKMVHGSRPSLCSTPADLWQVLTECCAVTTALAVVGGTESTQRRRTPEYTIVDNTPAEPARRGRRSGGLWQAALGVAGSIVTDALGESAGAATQAVLQRGGDAIDHARSTRAAKPRVQRLGACGPRRLVCPQITFNDFLHGTVSGKLYKRGSN